MEWELRIYFKGEEGLDEIKGCLSFYRALIKLQHRVTSIRLESGSILSEPFAPITAYERKGAIINRGKIVIQYFYRIKQNHTACGWRRSKIGFAGLDPIRCFILGRRSRDISYCTYSGLYGKSNPTYELLSRIANIRTEHHVGRIDGS